MSIETQLSIVGLARDPNAFKAAGAGALRRAENVVIRSESVAESRPNFTWAFESPGSSQRIRAMHEFDGAVVTTEDNPDDSSVWSAAVNGSGRSVVGGADLAFEPPFWEEADTSFAEARGNLYLTGLRGVLALENLDDSARFAGVNMRAVTDFGLRWAGNSLSPNRCYSYVFVFVRKDSSGYTRRSPPSPRIVCTLTDSPQQFGSGTRFYLPSQLVEGDQVEFYRSRTVEGIAPRAEHFLAQTYTVTAGAVSAGYFVPVTDNVSDDQLGAQLYTDAAQGGAIEAKYPPPPLVGSLAWWQRCMWYGRTRATQRLVVTLANLYRAGIAVFSSCSSSVPGRVWAVTSGSAAVTVSDTTGLEKGMYVTDNLKFGTTVAGVAIPANTYITGIVGTTVSLSHNATATGNIDVAALPLAPTQGLLAETTTATYVNGSPIITAIPSTAGMQPGMYWTTNNAAAGGATAASKVPAGTKILTVDSSVQVTLDHNATAAGVATTTYFGDVVTINSVDFYAWLGTGAIARPWDTSAQPLRTFFIGDPLTNYSYLGTWAIGLTVQNLCAAINAYAIATPTWRVWATPVGDVCDGFDFAFGDDGLRATLGGALTTSFLLEEGSSDGAHYFDGIAISSSCSAAFSPTLPLSTENDTKPNRVFFSDLDEPESVPLVNYIDIGSLDEPIQALVPLRVALLVFKTDGLWRITGSGPSSWSVDPLDASVRLVRPETVCAMNGTAYAWCDRGFFAVTESSARSLSANLLDVELRAAALLVVGHPTTHGAFVIGWGRHNLVLLGVPDATEATACAKVYAFCLDTSAWSEWPVSWGAQCEGRSRDAVYYSRPPDDIVDYEVRVAVQGPPRGWDREVTLVNASLAADLVTITVALPDCGAWEPAIGDFVGAALFGSLVYSFRRVTGIVLDAGVYTITLESTINAPDSIEAPPTWVAREASNVVIEWHPTAPAGVPTGTICRELQVQMDLRSDDTKYEDVPTKYEIGATSERMTGEVTLTSRKARVAQIQPIRVGASRTFARAASLAPILKTSDIFAQRVLGISLVHERTSERTTR